jgi:hypothetical protein
MGIPDLQEAWSRMSADPSGNRMLDEEQIRAMLGKRSKTLMEKIDFNIRTGIFLLLSVIAAIFSYDIFRASGWFGNGTNPDTVPEWLLLSDLAVNLLIIALCVTFYLRYFKVRRLCRDHCDMRHALMKVIALLTLYQRFFTMILVIIMLTSATGFIAGYYTSIVRNHTSEGFLIPVISFGILLIGLLTWLLFLLLRGIFRRIYGNYLAQLRETLEEMDELK